jgi:fumarate hydratase subunit alpha
MVSERAFVAGVVELIQRAETVVPDDYRRALRRILRSERNRTTKTVLRVMIENAELAERLQRPVCQDTGVLTFFIRLGAGVPFNIERAIRVAVSKAERTVPLRPHLVDPLGRRPLRVSRPKPEIHVEFDPGARSEIGVVIKGAGTENFSRLWMLPPSSGARELGERLADLIRDAGGKPCPPVVVGLGIGGSASQAVVLAKRALLRRIDRPNPRPHLGKLERELERRANARGAGVMGLGGVTVLRVLAEESPCHTATLPVGVALQCWPGRRGRAVIAGGRLEVIDP